jgi:short-subunit dehydrogenase involved in D-alanine esterification of teichoic acids
LAQEGNQIILVGRTENKLIEASKQIPNAQYIVADLTKASDVEELTTKVKSDFPTLNLLINNAGTAYAYSLLNENSKAVDKASVEFETNFKCCTLDRSIIACAEAKRQRCYCQRKFVGLIHSIYQFTNLFSKWLRFTPTHKY